MRLSMPPIDKKPQHGSARIFGITELVTPAKNDEGRNNARQLLMISQSEKQLIRPNMSANMKLNSEYRRFREQREADMREHKRIMALENKVNTKVASAACLANTELRKLDKVINTCGSYRTLDVNRNSSVEPQPSRQSLTIEPSPQPMDDEAKRSAFFLRLNQINQKRKKPKRLIIRQKSIKELKFFKQEMTRQTEAPVKNTSIKRQISECDIEETPLWVRARRQHLLGSQDSRRKIMLAAKRLTKQFTDEQMV